MLTFCSLLFLVSSLLTDESRGGSSPQSATAAAAAADLPVIVLTGFEPFGEKRPPNPSWEGIAALHNTQWQGHRIVAVQLPVVWGAPQQTLAPEIARLNPVAVFSFGQGRPGAFAIETRALNQRGPIPDNTGQTPPQPLVAGDGPTEYRSSFPFQPLCDHLNTAGFQTRISENAGQYLCEETLFTLELLRRRAKTPPDVAFCHVPPLGSQIGQQFVDAQYVRSFVLQVLTGWQAGRQASVKQPDDPASPAPAAAPVIRGQSPGDGKKSTGEKAAVEKLIEEYFKSWSEQRMQDYGSCFADGAVIQEIGSGSINTQMKGPFVAQQTTYHKLAIFKAVEVPVRTSIQFEADLCRVVVYWKLTAGPRVQYGYDHFTLMKQKGSWKIVNLVFYGTSPEKN
ncbi:MAG: nuclear transport factor 2 family protein [Planctomycetaceae bacterium]